MRTFIKFLPLLFCLPLIGCGGSVTRFIDSYDFQLDGSGATLSTVLSDDINLDIEQEIQFQEYGTLVLGPNAEGLFSISAMLDLAIFSDTINIALEPETTLPNGQAFPRIVEGSLIKIPLYENTSYNVDGYLGVNHDKYLGINIQFDFFDQKFPAELNFTQSFYIGNKKVVSLVVYGPLVDENDTVIQHGGIFLASNIDDMMKKDWSRIKNKLKHGKIFVSGKNAKKYRSKKAQANLYRRFRQRAEKSGVLKKK